MPDLSHCLKEQDLGFLRIVAQLWGMDLSAPDARAFRSVLLRQMQTPALIREVVESLPEPSREALDSLASNEGWMPWSRFTREYGLIREVGPGRRDRDKPYLDPISATEHLWYRGLIGRDFLRREGELQECVYIPDEVLAALSPVRGSQPQPLGRPASPGETAAVFPVNDRILDHTCTLLAALRMSEPERSPALADWVVPVAVVQALLEALKLVTASGGLDPEAIRQFLEMPRGAALTWVVQGWLHSDQFNELRQIPTLICEGAWQNAPRAARGKVLAWLSELPKGRWWHLDSFIAAVRQREADFQRPAGDFDSWLVRDARTGESLQGMQHWGAVDGALVRYLVTGPLHWLGLVDLAGPQANVPMVAFRFSGWAAALLAGQAVAGLTEERESIEVLSEGLLRVPRLAPRVARYQVARFCEWKAETSQTYTYRLTPTSLQEASGQGLKEAHLETLLNKYSPACPPTFLEALRQWDRAGGQARIQAFVVLRVARPQILQALRESPAARFLEDPLGPTAVIIQPGAVKKVRAALARLGYLSDVAWEGILPLTDEGKEEDEEQS